MMLRMGMDPAGKLGNMKAILLEISGFHGKPVWILFLHDGIM